MNSTIQRFDGVFKEVNNVFSSIELVRKQYDLDVFNKSFLPYQLNTSAISNMMSAKDYIEEIALIHQDQDLLITSQGSINENTFFEKQYSNTQYNTAFWKNIVGTPHDSIIIQSSQYYNYLSGFEDESKKLIGIIGSNLVYNSEYEILVFINEEKLFNMLEIGIETNKTLINVYDNKDNLIIESEGMPDSIKTKKAIKEDDKGEILTIEGQRYYRSISKYNNFIYLMRINEKSTDVSRVEKNALIILILNIFLGILLAFILSFYINKPFRHLFGMFSSQKIESGDDTLEYIKNRIIQIQNENMESKDKISVISREIKSSIFIKVVNNSSYYSKNKEMVETVFDDILGYSNYLMISIEMKEPIFAEEKDSMIISISEATGLKNVVVEEDNHNLIFIFAFETDSYKKSEISSKFYKALKEVGQEKKCSTFISSVFESLATIYEGYSDIEICKAYRVVSEENAIVDIDFIEPITNIYFPEDLKGKINNFILSGMAKECIDIIKQIIDENINNKIHVTGFRMLVNLLYGTVVETLLFCKCDKYEMLTAEQLLLKQIENKTIIDVKKIKKIFSNIIQLTLGELKESNISTSRLSAANIIPYINENYSNDLYLGNMAEEFGTTPKYFSNFFSKEIGVTFTEYLTNIRVNKAKEYLCNTDLQVNEIAESVGYNNATTFTNSFKRCTGIAPVKFRELNRRT